MKMPETGRPWEDIREDMQSRGASDAKWRDGRTAVYVFNAGEEIAKIQKEAYAAFMSENGLGPLAFPSLAQMEKDVFDSSFRGLHYDLRVIFRSQKIFNGTRRKKSCSSQV